MRRVTAYGGMFGAERNEAFSIRTCACVISNRDSLLVSNLPDREPERESHLPVAGGTIETRVSERGYRIEEINMFC